MKLHTEGSLYVATPEPGEPWYRELLALTFLQPYGAHSFATADHERWRCFTRAIHGGIEGSGAPVCRGLASLIPESITQVRGGA